MGMIHIGGIFDKAVGTAEGCSVNFFGTGVTAVLTMKKPTKEEIEAIESGDIKYKLAVVDGIPFFIVKYGELPWMEMPVLKSKDVSLELSEGEFKDGVGYALTTILCDVPSGVVKAMRVVGMESDVSNALNKAIIEEPESNSIIDAFFAISAIQRQYTQDQIIEKATYHGEIIKNN